MTEDIQEGIWSLTRSHVNTRNNRLNVRMRDRNRLCRSSGPCLSSFHDGNGKKIGWWNLDSWSLGLIVVVGLSTNNLRNPVWEAAVVAPFGRWDLEISMDPQRSPKKNAVATWAHNCIMKAKTSLNGLRKLSIREFKVDLLQILPEPHCSSSAETSPTWLHNKTSEAAMPPSRTYSLFESSVWYEN